MQTEGKFKYNPDDYEDDVREDMQYVYNILLGKSPDNLYNAVIRLYFSIKHSIKFEEIDPAIGKEMQDYFWGFV